MLNGSVKINKFDCDPFNNFCKSYFPQLRHHTVGVHETKPADVGER